MKQPIVGDWRGAPVYQCPDCAFDSHDAGVVAEHMTWMHPEPQPVAKPVVDPVVKKAKVEAGAAIAVNGEVK